MTEELKIKTHTSIGIKLETRARLEELRKYSRETYDEIIVRAILAYESKRGKKEIVL